MTTSRTVLASSSGLAYSLMDMLDAVKTTKAALGPLYAVLSDDQKRNGRPAHSERSGQPVEGAQAPRL
jgi:hypothetical protein